MGHLAHPGLLPVLLPLIAFFGLVLVYPMRRAGLPAAIFSSVWALGTIIASAAALMRFQASRAPDVVSVPWIISGGHTIASLSIRLDGISATMMLVVAIVASCVQIYSIGYLHDEPRGALGRYYVWQSLFLFSMALLVMAGDLLTLFIAWELVGLCSYLLIGYWWAKPSAAKAAVKALWTTKFADMGFLIALMMLYASTGGFGWDKHPAGTVGVAIAALLFVGVMGKSAQFPLHVWLPDAMEGPTPVSALLHAATMVAAGVYMIVRVYPLFEAAAPVLLVMAWIGALTAFLAACIAVVQNDIKKVLAYSTCSQLGYMVAGLGSGHLMGGYFHLTTHAFFKALLFLGAGAAIHVAGSNSIHDMGGLRRKSPLNAALFIGGAMALGGVPLFSGFFSKDLILEELQHAGLMGPLVLCLAAAALTAFYMTRVIAVAYFGRPSDHLARRTGAESHGAATHDAHGHANAHGHAIPPTMVWPMIALAVLTLSVGWFGGRFAATWQEEYHFGLSPVGILAIVMAAGGLLAGYFRYGPRSMEAPAALAPLRSFILSGPIDRFWDTAYRRGLLVVSAMAGWCDRYVVDGLMNFIGWSTIAVGARIRAFQTGVAQDYVTAVIVGVIVVVALGLLRS